MKIQETSYRRNQYRIEANFDNEINVFDTKPNVVFIRNINDAEITVGLDFVPNDINFDEIIAGNSKQSIVRPKSFNKIYIRSSQSGYVIVETFTLDDIRPTDIPEFQPIIFQSNGDVTLGNVQKIIDPLPAGTNTLGKVEITNIPELPSGANTIGNVVVNSLPSIPSGTNNIGKVDVNSLPDIVVDVASVTIDSALPAGTNIIGKVEVTNMEFTNTPAKITLVANTEYVVTASTCKLLLTMCNLSDLEIRDSTSSVKWIGNLPNIDSGITLNGLRLFSVTGGDVYIIYR